MSNIKNVGGPRRPLDPNKSGRGALGDARSKEDPNFAGAVQRARTDGTTDTSQHQTIVTDRLDTVGLQLGEARRRAGVTQIKLANQLSTTQSSLARLEKGTSVPNLRTVIKYANAIGFELTTQLHKADDQQLVDAVPPSKLVGRLTELRKEKGITQTEVAARMSATQPIVARLERGDAAPNLKTLDKFAKALGFQLSIRLSPDGKGS